MSIKTHVWQLSRYALAGGMATAVHLLTAWVMIYFFALSVFFANSLAFFTAFIFSYVLQTMFVFQSVFQWQRFFKFFAVQYSAFLVSFSLSLLLPVDNHYVQTFLIVFMIPLLTFLVHKLWTFKTL
ncbi:MAG: GtrA family protein [Ghiorsea sp.]|nr:GtrA family protein [Ghiorsea sp.]